MRFEYPVSSIEDDNDNEHDNGYRTSNIQYPISSIEDEDEYGHRESRILFFRQQGIEFFLESSLDVA